MGDAVDDQLPVNRISRRGLLRAVACLAGVVGGACFGGVICFCLAWVSISNAGAGAGMQDLDVSGVFKLCIGFGVVMGAVCGFFATLLATKLIPIDDPRR
jgi:hypothetical protein